MKKTMLACALGFLAIGAKSNAAVYDIEVLPANDLANNLFAQSIDNSGTVTLTTQNLFNQTIDVELLDFDSLALNSLLSDPDSSRTGNFNDFDYLLLISTLRSNTASNTATTQKLATFRSFQYDGQTTTELEAFDNISRSTRVLTQSNQVIVRDSEAGNFFVGTSDDGFEVVEFTNESGVSFDFVINDFRNVAFVQLDDTVSALLPPDQTAGGSSDAYAINNQLQVAGSGTVSVIDAVTASVELCLDDDTRGDIPVEFCLWRLNYPDAGGIGVFESDTTAQTRAIIWSVDGSGNLANTETFGLLEELDEGNTTTIALSQAVAINDNGIAVGFSQTFVREAAAFFNGQISRVLDPDDFLQSEATAINNNDFVAGTFVEDIDGVFANKMFITNLQSSEVDEPVGFFSTSNTVPRDMSNENLVVGQGQVTSTSSNSSELHGFIYDISSEEFLDLNNLIDCDSPYTLIDATGINDDGVIAVTGRASVPARNELGETFVDETGAQVLIDGSLALRLVPIPNGQADDCEEINDDDFERQGASLNPTWLLSLFGLMAFRRFKRKWN